MYVNSFLQRKRFKFGAFASITEVHQQNEVQKHGFSSLKRRVFTLHFTDEAPVIEVKVLNLDPFSPKKSI